MIEYTKLRRERWRPSLHTDMEGSLRHIVRWEKQNINVMLTLKSQIVIMT